MTDLLPLDPFDHMLRPRGYPGTPSCDEVPPDVRQAAFERDGYACRYCGFAAGDRYDGYVGLHHLDHDHANNDLANLVPACMHCHGAHHAAHWADRGHARLVLLPEMSQAALSVLSRVMGVARLAPDVFARDKGMAGILHGMRNGETGVAACLEARAKAAEDMLGTSDPSVLYSYVDTIPSSIDVGSRLAPFRVWLTLVGAEAEDREGFCKSEVVWWMREEGPYAWLGDTGHRRRHRAEERQARP